MNTPPYADLETWVAALMRPGALLELAVLAACVVLAWRLSFWIAKVFVGRDGTSIMFGRRIVDGVLFPTLLLFFAFLMRKVLAHSMGLMVFNLAIPVLFSLVCIRLAVKVLQAAFNETPLIRLLEHSISWLVWLALVLWVSGLLPLVMEELD
jgi:hypothetical protein